MTQRSPVVALSPATSSAKSDSRYAALDNSSGATSAARRLSSPGRRLRAPSPYDSDSESDGAQGPAPSFSLQAPSGLSDSDGSGSEDGVVHSRRRASEGGAPALPTARPLGAAEIALAEVTLRLDHALQLRVYRQVSQLQRDLAEVDAAERAAAASAAEERRRQEQELAAVDARRRQQGAQGREQLLLSLRTRHEQQAAEAARQVAELEAAARERERREHAAAEARAQAAEAKAAAEAAAQQQRSAEQEQQAAARAAQASAAKAKAEVRQREAEANAAAASQPGILTLSPGAAELKERCATRLAAAQQEVAPFVADRAMRDAKRSIDKFVTLNVQQISATLEQVRAKSASLAGFVSRHAGAQRTYALLTLASKLLSQCEVQVTRLHAFAFPLGEVAAAVAAAHPDFVDLLLGHLHQACPLAVPAHWGFRPGGDELGYLRLAGYRVTQDEDNPGAPAEKESTDEFIGRMQGYVMLYAALTQSDNPGNPHGVPNAWAYLARLLNALPANRATAAALDAFLKVAGFRLAATYRGQFAKLLGVVEREFLPALSSCADPDARAVYTRLQTYLCTRQFLRPPEGRNMPRHDASSYDRA